MIPQWVYHCVTIYAYHVCVCVWVWFYAIVWFYFMWYKYNFLVRITIQHTIIAIYTYYYSCTTTIVLAATQPKFVPVCRLLCYTPHDITHDDYTMSRNRGIKNERMGFPVTQYCCDSCVTLNGEQSCREKKNVVFRLKVQSHLLRYTYATERVPLVSYMQMYSLYSLHGYD